MMVVYQPLPLKGLLKKHIRVNLNSDFTEKKNFAQSEFYDRQFCAKTRAKMLQKTFKKQLFQSMTKAYN